MRQHWPSPASTCSELQVTQTRAQPYYIAYTSQFISSGPKYITGACHFLVDLYPNFDHIHSCKQQSQVLRKFMQILSDRNFHCDQVILMLSCVFPIEQGGMRTCSLQL